MNGASDQPEEFGVHPERDRQEEPQSGTDATASADSDATASSSSALPAIPAAFAAA